MALVSAAFTGAIAPVRGNVIVYVDVDATGPVHDGTNWCAAFTTLHEALAAINTNGTIRTAGGTYIPDPTGLANPREASFDLASGVAIEGGYAGCGALNPDERDLLAYETILSGDLDGDDHPGVNNSENSYHVLRGSGTDATAVLDGVTVTGGHASGGSTSFSNLGGGFYAFQGNPTLRRCTFRGNLAQRGGGVYTDTGSPTFIACVFSDNDAMSASGGGAYLFRGDALVSG